MTCLELNIKYWTSTNLNSMTWLGLFTNKIFRKHLKLIFPHWDFIICIVSLEISVSSPFCHPHSSILIFPSSFYHPHFSIRILSSAFFYPPSAAIRSALYSDPLHSVTCEFTCAFICFFICQCASFISYYFQHWIFLKVLVWTLRGL